MIGADLLRTAEFAGKTDVIRMVRVGVNSALRYGICKPNPALLPDKSPYDAEFPCANRSGRKTL
jgi:hypothetical protein